MGLHMVMAATVFDNLKSSLNTLQSNLTSLAWPIFITMCILAGIAWVAGGRGAEWAKGTLGKIIIGVFIVSLAAVIISTFRSMSGGSI